MNKFLFRKNILKIAGVLGIGAIIAKGLYDYSSNKTLKWVENQLKRNSWDYYE